jgi:hypothetical protein
MDCWPTLVDIERTHVLFMNAHYKPFVAIGYEYNKVKAQNGTPSFGTTVTFSIPQFGDFFYDIVCRVRFNNWQLNFEKTPAQSIYNPKDTSSCEDPATAQTWDPETGESIHDINWWTKKFPANSADGSQQFRLVNYLGEVLVVGGSAENLVQEGESTPAANINSSCDLYQSTVNETVSIPSQRRFTNLARWVEYPADRLFKKVWFNVNNNPLDEYTDFCSVMYNKFCVAPGKRVGYDRMAGQEVPKEGWSGVKRYEVLNSDNTSQARYNWLNPQTWFETGIEPSTLHFQRSDAGTSGIRNACNPNSNVNGIHREDVNNGTGNGDVFHFGDPYLARYLHQIVDGPQTPKEVQPSLEIMHKLHFWFNDDVRLAVPSVSIPYGQRFISIDIAELGDMIDQEPGLYVEKVQTDLNTGCLASCATVTPSAIEERVNKICQKGADGTSEDVFDCGELTSWFQDIFAGGSCCGTGSSNLYNSCNTGVGIRFVLQGGCGDKQNLCQPSKAEQWLPGGRPCGVAKVVTEYYPWVHEQDPSNLIIENMEMYINNIFVNPEIHDIYIRRIGFTLIRVHRYASITVNEETAGEKLISQLKWPVEYIFVGLRPKWNINRNNRWMWRDWHRMTKVDTGFFPEEGVRIDLFARDKARNSCGGADTSNNIARLERREIQKTQFVYESNTVQRLNVTAHGITLYDLFGDMFYNAYLPYHFGGYNIVTPKDPGALMINFCLYPKTYQPSGHINVSRAREFYIGWESNYVNSQRTADLLIVASTINFLLISDGSAVLRYST